MKTTSKIILAFSAACIAFSFTEIGANFYYGIIRPVGAVAFIVFFIVNMLGKEMSKFEGDHLVRTKKKDDAVHIRPRHSDRLITPQN
jgi:hypothetical protein